MGMSMDIPRMLSEYREAAHGTSATDPKLANRSHGVMHGIYKTLRQTDGGRRGILSLTKDSSPHVRLWAAAHSLEWAPDPAREALEALRESGGACSFDAEITLEQHHEGELSFDY